MEITTNDFETVTDSMIFEDQQAYSNFPGGDEEDDDNESDDDDSGNAPDDDSGNAPGDDNPPLDEGVVHSPLPTQTGGKPRGK